MFQSNCIKTNSKNDITITIIQLWFKIIFKNKNTVNRNTVKISYSCMRKMNSIISAHNRSTLNPPKTSHGCNCRENTNYPLQIQCFTPNIVYQSDVSKNVDKEKRVHLGVSETLFKERYSNHVRNSKHER